MADEGGVDYHDARQRILLGHAREMRPADHARLRKRNYPGDAVIAVADRIPFQHMDVERARQVMAVFDRVPDVLVFGLVDLSKTP